MQNNNEVSFEETINKANEVLNKFSEEMFADEVTAEEVIEEEPDLRKMIDETLEYMNSDEFAEKIEEVAKKNHTSPKETAKLFLFKVLQFIASIPGIAFRIGRDILVTLKNALVCVYEKGKDFMLMVMDKIKSMFSSQETTETVNA